VTEKTKSMVDLSRKIVAEVSKVVVGKSDTKEILLIALLSEGHVLIEGLAGTAKTLLAKTFAQVVGGRFKRIQFTPDMLPADVTGFNVYSSDGKSRFVPGPLFANVVLNDELNRTTPRTQAALIEAMQEMQVTVEGVSYLLPKPFMVIASQLPAGSEGTYPLTEVQADRFMFRVWSDYLNRNEESQVLERIDFIESPDIHPVVSPDEVMMLQEEAKKVQLSEAVRDYVVSVVSGAREDSDVLSGPSTRATVSLFKGSRTLAFLRERDFVIPDDVKRLAYPVLEHRLRIRPEAEMDGVEPKMVVERVLKQVAVPKPE
jgi:MoxR-like ATPase